MDQQDHTKDLNLKNRWYFIDLSASVELFLILRGIIAGCVTISVSASNFYPWTALVNGVVGGFLYIAANKVFYIMQIDDAMHIATTHGITAFYSLFSICLFHKDEGFFFNDVYLRSQNLLSVMTED
jgi:ammonia channel protein AmtB